MFKSRDRTRFPLYICFPRYIDRVLPDKSNLTEVAKEIVWYETCMQRRSGDQRFGFIGNERAFCIKPNIEELMWLLFEEKRAAIIG